MFIHESLYIYYVTNTWWVDLVATIYVANLLQGFNNEENSKKREKKIRVASEVATKAEAIGEFSLILRIFFFRLRLHYVPYVPSTKENSESISS